MSKIGIVGIAPANKKTKLIIEVNSSDHPLI
jgi:hypothetical protein